MYNKQIDTFLKVAETGSFSKAAQASFISPTAVIQQINSLEQNLKTVLFERTRHGVTLTEAGRYFRAEAMTLISKDKEIREHLQKYARTDTTIRVGLSMMHKVRLLFDLWVLFSENAPADTTYDMQLINLPPGSVPSAEADVIEGINLGLSWQQTREFLKICDVPMAIGVPKTHPLSSRTLLSPEDLSGNTVLMPEHTHTPELHALHAQLSACTPNVREITDYSMSAMWECSCNQYLMVVPQCMQDVMADLTLIPCSWHHTIPYGLLSVRRPSQAVRELLSFTEGVYSGSVDVGIVPVLDLP